MSLLILLNFFREDKTANSLLRLPVYFYTATLFMVVFAIWRRALCIMRITVILPFLCLFVQLWCFVRG